MGKRIALWVVTVLSVDAFVFGCMFGAPDGFMVPVTVVAAVCGALCGASVRNRG